MTYFALMSKNVTFTDHIPEIRSVKVTNDKCQCDDNKPLLSDLSAHIRDIRPVIGSDMTHYKELKKGMKVRLRGGKELVVKEFCEHWAWCNDNSLPVHRSVIG